MEGGGKGACAPLDINSLAQSPQTRIWRMVSKATSCGKEALTVCRTDRAAGGKLALQYARLVYDAALLAKQHATAGWYRAEMQRLRGLYRAGRPMLGPTLHRLLDAVLKKDPV